MLESPGAGVFFLIVATPAGRRMQSIQRVRKQRSAMKSSLFNAEFSLEKSLQFIAILVVIVGLVLVVLFQSSLSDIPSGSHVEIRGTITKVTGGGIATRIVIQPAPQIPLVVFNQDLHEGERVVIRGRIADYKGRVELVADEVAHE